MDGTDPIVTPPRHRHPQVRPAIRGRSLGQQGTHGRNRRDIGNFRQVIQGIIGMGRALVERLDRARIGIGLDRLEAVVIDPHPAPFLGKVKDADEMPDRLVHGMNGQHVQCLPN